RNPADLPLQQWDSTENIKNSSICKPKLPSHTPRTRSGLVATGLSGKTAIGMCTANTAISGNQLAIHIRAVIAGKKRRNTGNFLHLPRSFQGGQLTDLGFTALGTSHVKGC